MGVEYNQPAHLLDRYIEGGDITVVDCIVLEVQLVVKLKILRPPYMGQLCCLQQL